MSLFGTALRELLQQGTLTGFALITAHGPSEPIAGELFLQQCAQGVSASIHALIRPFYSACDPPTTHTLNGTKLQVIQQTDAHYVAISKQRQLGLIALNTPLGVLLASFDRAASPTAALAAVQAACSARSCSTTAKQQQCTPAAAAPGGSNNNTTSSSSSRAVAFAAAAPS